MLLRVSPPGSYPSHPRSAGLSSLGYRNAGRPTDRTLRTTGRCSITDHEYDIEAEGRKVAEVSKKWFRARDTYGVQVVPDENAVLVLAVTVTVDTMAHESK